MSYQKTILVGNLTKDGELKYSQSGSAIYSNSIAITKKFTQNGERKEKTMFIDVAAFSKLAETMNQYLHKGSKVLLDGEIDFQQWVTQDGAKRSKHSLNINSMQMLDSKADAPKHTEYQAPQQKNTDYQPQQQQAQQMPARQSIPEIEVDEEEIPF